MHQRTHYISIDIPIGEKQQAYCFLSLFSLMDVMLGKEQMNTDSPLPVFFLGQSFLFSMDQKKRKGLLHKLAQAAKEAKKPG